MGYSQKGDQKASPFVTICGDNSHGPLLGPTDLTPEQVLLTKPNRVVVERDRGSGGHQCRPHRLPGRAAPLSKADA